MITKPWKFELIVLDNENNQYTLGMFDKFGEAYKWGEGHKKLHENIQRFWIEKRQENV